MHVVEFQPLLKRIRWGGDRLGRVLGKRIGDEGDYAESWEVVDHGFDQSVVTGGEFEGWTLRRLVEQQASALFGSRQKFDQFPLLIKFLDATDRLSVQVHPNDEQAKRFDASENGKTEAWVIIDAEPKSQLYAGLKSGVDREDLSRHLRDGTVEVCLHSFEVHPGDCLFIPSGTVHAIGEGILLAEVQQSSDLTFRMYDWGRLGADGQPRELHIESSMQCIDFDRGPVNPVEPREVSTGPHSVEELVHASTFAMFRHTAREPFVITADDRFRVLTILGGRATWSNGPVRGRCEIGQTLLLPASAPRIEFEPDGELIVLESFVP